MFPITARPLAFIGDRERPVALPPYSSRGAAPCKSIDAVSSKLIPSTCAFRRKRIAFGNRRKEPHQGLSASNYFAGRGGQR